MPAPTKQFHFGRNAIARRRAVGGKLQSNLPALRRPRLHLVANNDAASAGAAENTAISDAFSTCRQSHAELAAATVSSDVKLHSALADVLSFYQIGDRDEESRLVYERLLRDAGIKVTRSTKNSLLPALKAVFGPTNKSSQGRYAAALYQAHAEGVTPEKFAQFVREKNGLVECAKEGAKRLNPRAAADKAKREKEALIALQAASKPLSMSCLSKQLPLGLSVALVSKGADGALTLLAHRAEKEAAVSRFNSLT